MTLVAGVDSSTQSCKVVVRDLETGALVRSGRAAHPEGTEVDPEAWWEALREAVTQAGGLGDVAAISIAGQQHGMVALNAEGRIVRKALLWNDTRSADAAAELVAEVGAAEYARRTGSVPVASFTATKLRWLREAEPDNAARVAAVALPHDWLTWRLRGYGPVEKSPLGPVLDELVTDRSDASGTAYWSPATGDYDDELLERALGRCDVVLPRVLGPAEPAGWVSAAVLRDWHLASKGWTRAARAADTVSDLADSTCRDAVTDDPATLGAATSERTRELLELQGSPTHARDGRAPNCAASSTASPLIGPGAGDNAAAALGLGASSGDVVVSLGTSGTVFAVTDRPVADPSGAVAGFADASGVYLPLVATLNAARVLSSTAKLLGVSLDELSGLALHAQPGSDGVVLVPYFEGERTPNLPHATASLHGLTIASTTRENIARASVEGMLSGLGAGLDAVRALGVEARRLLLVGGAAQNPAVQRIAAQVFDTPVVVPEPGEYVADGAAAQAAWVLTGHRPTWPLAIAATPAPDYHPIIRAQYARYAASYLSS